LTLAPTHAPPLAAAAGKRAALRLAAHARGADMCRSVLAALRSAAARPALPASVASTARGAAQLRALGLGELLPQIAWQPAAGAAAVLLVLAPEAGETRGPRAPAACGLAAAAAALLAGSSAEAGGGRRVVVLLHSEWRAAQEAGGEEGVRAWLQSRLGPWPGDR
jgi:hypothetical protein